MRSAEVKAGMRVGIGSAREWERPTEAYILSTDRWYTTMDDCHYPADRSIRKADTGFPCAIRRERLSFDDDMRIVDSAWTWEPHVVRPRQIKGLWVDVFRAYEGKLREAEASRGKAMSRNAWIEDSLARLARAGVNAETSVNYSEGVVTLRMSDDDFRRLVGRVEL